MELTPEEHAARAAENHKNLNTVAENMRPHVEPKAEAIEAFKRALDAVQHVKPRGLTIPK